MCMYTIAMPPTTPPPPAGPRILLVEDDQMFGDILKKRFTASGATIVHVPNGKDALAAVAKEALFDLLLLDVAPS